MTTTRKQKIEAIKEAHKYIASREKQLELKVLKRIDGKGELRKEKED